MIEAPRPALLDSDGHNRSRGLATELRLLVPMIGLASSKAAPSYTRWVMLVTSG